MACQNICKLCNHLVISTSVAFDATTNTLTITIPNGSYQDGEKYCIVVAQTIPTNTTVAALVSISTNGGTFPLTKCNCAQVTACEIKTRTKYSTRVQTNTTSGVFRLLSIPKCCPPSNLSELPTTTTTATQGE